MARPPRPERSGSARSSRQLSRFYHSINPDRVFGTHTPAEHPVSRIARPDVLLSLVRAPALPPQHADFGSQFHTPSNRCLRFGPRVTATPARLAPVLPARLWTDQTFTGKLIPAFLSHPASGSRTRRHAFACNAICSF